MPTRVPAQRPEPCGGNQLNSRWTGEIWSNFLAPLIIRAAKFCTCCIIHCHIWKLLKGNIWAKFFNQIISVIYLANIYLQAGFLKWCLRWSYYRLVIWITNTCIYRKTSQSLYRYRASRRGKAKTNQQRLRPEAETKYKENNDKNGLPRFSLLLKY